MPTLSDGGEAMMLTVFLTSEWLELEGTNPFAVGMVVNHLIRY